MSRSKTPRPNSEKLSDDQKALSYSANHNQEQIPINAKEQVDAASRAIRTKIWFHFVDRPLRASTAALLVLALFAAFSPEAGSAPSADPDDPPTEIVQIAPDPSPTPRASQIRITIFGRTLNLTLSVGTLGIVIILVMGLLLLTAVLLALFARRRAWQTRAVNLKLKEEIAERERAEASLRESEERLRAIVDAALDGVIAMDHEGRIVDFSTSAEGIFDYRKSEVVGQLLAEKIVPVASREMHRRGLEHFLATGEGPVLGKRIELTAMRSEGTEFPVELSITRVGLADPPLFTGFVRDITERKASEKALRESGERYRLLFESNPLPMWVYDFETLRFLEVNDAAIRHYGYSREEFLSMTITEIRPQEDLEALLDHVTHVNSPFGMTHIWRHRKKDGTIIDVEITAHSLDLNGRPARLVLANDMTERRTLEEQLRQSQKMEAIGMLAGGIAHDFNNLLTAITGYSELALRRLNATDPSRSNIEEILKAGDRATALTRQLLAFSRKQVLQPKVIDLNSVVSDMEKMLRRLIGENIAFRTVLDPQLGNTKADPGQIEQVIVNLVVNARDAMPNGGKLTIETRNVYLDKDYARMHISVVPGPFVMLGVSDTGIGMDEETRRRIFEPFFSTKEPGKGTGLGLSTTYGIVKQSGGNIWVYSVPGRGTTFKIYLPRVEEHPQYVGVSTASEESLYGTETILLTEDEEIVRNLVRQVLEMYGYRVLTADSGEEALSICESSKEQIHLLITDVIMPGMSGRELADQTAILYPEIKVLYMSGYTDSAIVHQGVLDEGANFIQKPFQTDALVRKIKEVLDAPAND